MAGHGGAGSCLTREVQTRLVGFLQFQAWPFVQLGLVVPEDWHEAEVKIARHLAPLAAAAAVGDGRKRVAVISRL